jgi:hypothetical protein
MARSNRDEFSERIKRALDFRANHECSFPNCTTTMSGPSLESPDAYVSSGVAAHIHAAAPGPGARRYLDSMSPEERSYIDNGIWLCQNHAVEIDRDEVYYTADRLREMKAAHEARVAARRRGLTTEIRSDFVALGPELVFYGDVIGANEREWRIRVDNFLIGDLPKLLLFIDRFSNLNPYDRYVAVNMLGDGRQLAASPGWEKTDIGYVMSCPILGRFGRVPAQDLQTEYALNDAHDVFAANGRWATVSGLDALPQRIKSSLSLIRGESPMNAVAGTRITEYFELFRNSDLLASLVKLETIRVACIPYVGSGMSKPDTLLRCVQGVKLVEQLSRDPVNRWLTFRFLLDVEGIVGPWQRDIPLLVERVAKG